MMTDWYQRSINALQLNGKGERTQEAYTRAVRMLSTFYSKPPDEIAETELEQMRGIAMPAGCAPTPRAW